MAIALRRIRDRVRMRIRDTDSNKPTFNLVEMDQAIAEAYLALQARLPAAELHTASGLTISAGADTFTLPLTVTQWTGNDGGAEYAGDVRIRLRSNGMFLRKLNADEMDSYRAGVLPGNLNLSVPEVFNLWEDKDQAVQGRCYPGAKAAEVCDLFVTLTADDVRDFIGAGTSDMDDVEILFSRIGAQALVTYVAADMVARMTDEDLKLRKLNPGVVNLWRREAEVSLYEEASRRHDLDDNGRVMRWVS